MFPQARITLSSKGLVAKPNYGFEKRQKELAKQQKRQLKAERKANRLTDPSPDDPGMTDPDAAPPSGGEQP